MNGPGSWSEVLWHESMRPAYDAVLEHPFLRGIAEGTLPEDCFTYYLAQDAHYLDDFARALAVLAGRAPTGAATAMLAQRAAGVAEVERRLHEQLLGQVGVDAAALAAVPVSPTTHAYTRHLLAESHVGSFTDGLAAVLPCFWIYGRVGEALVGRGSPEPRYRTWLDTYAGEEFGAVVAEVLALVDHTGEDLTAVQQHRAARAALTSARYEWMFWDAAWRREEWPV